MSNDQQQNATTAATTAATSSLAPRPHGGYANAETSSVIRCLSSDQRADDAARAIVATAWWNASDEIAADSAAIVAPRAAAADALREWLEEEENPLADSASLYTDLLTHALARVDWGEVADHYAPDPLPSIEPLTAATAEEQPEQETREEGQETEEEQPGYSFTPVSPICTSCGADLSQHHHLPSCPLYEAFEEQPEEGDPDADDANATTDPADIEPGYLSADDMERLRRARGNRRFFH